VANALRLLRLPEAGLRALQEGRITPGHARALLPLEHPDRFAAALAMVVARSLSVRGTESLVRQLLRPPPAPRNNRSFERLSDELTRQLGARAKVKPRRKGGGSISIEYANVEDLDRLIGLMSR
jgi:ParB family chromosome partitioning protein